MLVCSFKLPKRAAAWTMGAAALCLIVLVAAQWFGSEAAMVTANGEKLGTAAASETQRIAFLEQFGWKVEPQPREVAQVTIPQEFGEVYEAYNALQKQQSCDLSRLKGKTVKRYTYTVTNYPSGAPGETVVANLLVYQEKVVGGDICSLDLGGFMHTFAMPSTPRSLDSQTA